MMHSEDHPEDSRLAVALLALAIAAILLLGTIGQANAVGRDGATATIDCFRPVLA